MSASDVVTVETIALVVMVGLNVVMMITNGRDARQTLRSLMDCMRKSQEEQVVLIREEIKRATSEMNKVG
jgi:hypothetical protein